jgi:hypothetical protein
MNYKRFICLYSFVCIMNISADAQFRIHAKPVNAYVLYPKPNPSKVDKLLLARQTQNVNQSPILSGTGAMPVGQMNSYWLTSTTTQSIKEGKMGTNYFWDHQGNLRESRFFVEVGGKRKPGLKLIFPRR